MHAQRVCIEFERTSTIVIGVNNNADIVVVLGRITIAQVRPYFCRIRIARRKPDVEISTVLHQIGDSINACWNILARLVFEAELNLSRISPSVLTEHAINVDFANSSGQIDSFGLCDSGAETYRQTGNCGSKYGDDQCLLRKKAKKCVIVGHTGQPETVYSR